MRPKLSRRGIKVAQFWSKLCPGMHPFRFAARPVFLLPDRHDLLQPINGMAAGLKGLGTMRATDDDRNADFAHFQMTQPMDHDHVADRPTLPRVLLDLRHLFLA